MTWNRYTKWWLAWGAAFLAIETSAVIRRRNHPGGSLSSLIWRFSDGTTHPWRRRVFLIGMVILFGHLMWGWIDI